MLLLIQSIIVYGFIVWIMTYFGKVAYKNQYPQGIGGIDKFANRKMSFASLFLKKYYFIPILIFCLFSAIRYKVGVDFDAYKRFFYEILDYGRVLDEGAVESGFTFLGKLTSAISSTHHLLFFLLAFLQISFFYYALRKRTYALIHLGLAIMTSVTYISLMNGVRQNIAACAFIAMVPLALEKKGWLWFTLCVAAATLMHKSAFALLPIGMLVYFVFQRGTLSVPIQLLIMFACLIFMDKFDTSYLERIYAFGEQAGYSANKIDTYSELELTTKSFGLWGITTFFIQVCAVIYSKKILSMTNDKVMTCMYNLSFVATCLDTLFYNNFGINRLNYYFIIFQPIILSLLLFYTSRSKKKIDLYVFRSIFTIMIIRYIYLLYTSLSNANECILYKFDLFRGVM